MREIRFRAWDRLLKFMFNNVSTGTVEIFDDGFKADSVNCEFMQFTGLLDSKGVEIYEGDIVKYKKYSFDFNAEIKYVDGAFMIWWTHRPPSPNGNFLFYDSDSCEVIGNIYENPTLLNDKGRTTP